MSITKTNQFHSNRIYPHWISAAQSLDFKLCHCITENHHRDEQQTTYTSRHRHRNRHNHHTGSTCICDIPAASCKHYHQSLYNHKCPLKGLMVGPLTGPTDI